ncbi:hypothetical protein ACUODF_57840, partial [Escherichia coli]
LFLNAKLPTGKEFMPREISLLIGEEGNPLSSQEILEGGESLILSEVAEPPSLLVRNAAIGSSSTSCLLPKPPP